MRNPAVAFVCERAFARSMLACCLSILIAGALGMQGETFLAWMVSGLAAFCAGTAVQAALIGRRFE